MKILTKSLILLVVVMSTFSFYQCNTKIVEPDSGSDSDSKKSSSVSDEDFIAKSIALMSAMQKNFGDKNTVLVEISKDEQGQPIAQFSLRDEPLTFCSTMIPSEPFGYDKTSAGKGTICLGEGATLTGSRNEDGTYRLKCN